MRALSFFVLWSLISIICCEGADAATLLFSTAGQFASSVTSTQLAAPGASWTLSFGVDSNPTAGSPDSLGFNAPFTGFSYSLNNTVIPVSPASIRFYTANNLGMFTVFFGPQSGFSGGVPVPEFSFQGPQLFSGSTSSPAFTTNVYPVSEFIYSDASNYDDHVPANFSVTVSNAPEPSPLAALVLGLTLVGCSRLYRLRRQQ